jgi:hypothetical protein
MTARLCTMDPLSYPITCRTVPLDNVGRSTPLMVALRSIGAFVQYYSKHLPPVLHSAV